MKRLSNGEFNIWKCLACEGCPEFEKQEFIEHVKQVHKVPENAKGDRKLLMHLDSRDFFESIYRWTINDLEFTQCVRCKRAPDDMMAYG